MFFIFSSSGLDSVLRKEDAVESIKNRQQNYEKFQCQTAAVAVENLSVPVARISEACWDDCPNTSVMSEERMFFVRDRSGASLDKTKAISYLLTNLLATGKLSSRCALSKLCSA